MVNLIITVISIALISAMTVLTANLVPMDAYQRSSLQKEAILGVKSLENTVTRYLNANRDINGNIIYPGDGVNVKGVITPAYGYLPANTRENMTWDIQAATVNGAPSVGICLHPVGAPTAVQQDALASAQSQLPVGATAIGESCWAATNVAGGTSLTYWVPLAHVN